MRKDPLGRGESHSTHEPQEISVAPHQPWPGHLSPQVSLRAHPAVGLESHLLRLVCLLLALNIPSAAGRKPGRAGCCLVGRPSGSPSLHLTQQPLGLWSALLLGTRCPAVEVSGPCRGRGCCAASRRSAPGLRSGLGRGLKLSLPPVGAQWVLRAWSLLGTSPPSPD